MGHWLKGNSMRSQANPKGQLSAGSLPLHSSTAERGALPRSQALTPEQALQLHKKFLQDVLQDVMKILDTGEAGVERMIRGLNAYWVANHKHRATRRKVQAALMGTPQENIDEPMGTPFLVMLRAELLADEVKNLDALAQEIYVAAREISVAEAASGRTQLKRREKLIAHIRQATSNTAAPK